MSLDVNIEPDEFNTTELHCSIKEAAKTKGIEEFDYHVEFANEKGENYTANLFRVLIKDSESDKSLRVIVKTLVNTTRQELFHELHKREVYVYREVLPKFEAVQKNVDEDKRMTLPECLYSCVDKSKQILILDDLMDRGFAMDDKLAKSERLDYLQVRLVIAELAKFHALSFVLEKKEPDSFFKLAAELQDIIFHDRFLNKSKLRSYFIDSYKASLKEVTDEDAKKKLEKLEPNLLKILRKFVQSSKHNVLCHGDCWMNNVLFKHEEMKQSRVCFLDFQAMRYANPALDILYFLYLCTDSKFRSDHLETLQNVYYDSLKTSLNLYDIDVNSVYPREDFFNDLEENRPFGLLMALIEMRIITPLPEIDIGRFEIRTDSFSIEDSTSCYKETEGKMFCMRINDVVKESTENGVLKKLVDEIN